MVEWRAQRGSAVLGEVGRAELAAGCTMVMPGDERQMPGGVEASGIEGPTTAMGAAGRSRRYGGECSSGEWVFGSVLAVLSRVSVG